MVSNVPKTRPAYPPEFRREAVQMLRAGRTPRELAQSLGVSEQTLRNWRRQDQADRRERTDVPTSAELEELRALRRENARLKQERDPLKTSRGLLRSRRERAPVTAYRLISAEKARTPVSVACQLLGVSRSGYYEWAANVPSARAKQDAELVERIVAIHGAYRGVYGSPRIHAELRLAYGIRVGRKRVERLMRQAAISGMVRRKRGRATISVPGVRVADDLRRAPVSPRRSEPALGRRRDLPQNL
jgi:transposase-like protein